MKANINLTPDRELGKRRTWATHAPSFEETSSITTDIEWMDGLFAEPTPEKWDAHEDKLHAKRIVDLGGGAGHLSSSLRARGYKNVINVDPVADEKVFSPCIRSNVEKMPIENQSVDFVIASSLLPYVNSPQAILREIRRILKKPSGNEPGGRLLLNFQNPKTGYGLEKLNAALVIALAHLERANRGKQLPQTKEIYLMLKKRWPQTPKFHLWDATRAYFETTGLPEFGITPGGNPNDLLRKAVAVLRRIELTGGSNRIPVKYTIAELRDHRERYGTAHQMSLREVKTLLKKHGFKILHSEAGPSKIKVYAEKTALLTTLKRDLVLRAKL